MATETPDGELEELCVDTIRTLSMDAVERAKSGHPGTPMALAPLAHVLFTRIMRHDPRTPGWPDRDRFVLSAGHASMLLYSILHLTGYDWELSDLESFRQIDEPGGRAPRARRCPGDRDDHRSARTGDLELGRPGAGRADAGRPLQPRRPRDRRPPHLRDRQRRRPDGGGGLGGLLAGRAPRARSPDGLLRRQPHHHRRRHLDRLHRGHRGPLRGLRLARDRPRRGPAPGLARGRGASGDGGGRPALAGHRAHSHRPGRADEAGHARRPRRAAGRG